MVLRSSYTQSVFSVYPIYTEDIIERYLIKSVNFFSGRAERDGRIVRTEKAGTSGTGEMSGSASRTGRDVRQVGGLGQVGQVGRVGQA